MSEEIKQRIVYVLTRKDKADDDGTDIYVGSTSLPLERRLYLHRQAAVIPGNGNNRLYKRMNGIGLDNWKVLPLLSRMCGIKTIREIERKWIRILSADLNSYLPIREEKMFKEYMVNYYVGYYKDNKGVILQQHAAYREKIKDFKRFYCGVCDIAYGSKRDLGRHFDTLKHSYNYLNSLD